MGVYSELLHAVTLPVRDGCSSTAYQMWGAVFPLMLA